MQLDWIAIHPPIHTVTTTKVAKTYNEKPKNTLRAE
jgi:hypothetical protein